MCFKIFLCTKMKVKLFAYVLCCTIHLDSVHHIIMTVTISNTMLSSMQ